MSRLDDENKLVRELVWSSRILPHHNLWHPQGHTVSLTPSGLSQDYSMEEILSLRCAVGGGVLHFLLIYRIQGIRIPLATATFHPHAIALPGVFLCANISKISYFYISRDQGGLSKILLIGNLLSCINVLCTANMIRYGLGKGEIKD